MSAATAQLNFQLCTFPNAVGCSNRSSSLMWLDWSFHQASHCWLHGTLGSSGSTQPHGSKGRLTLVTTAGTAQPSPDVPEQMPCAALCPCGKLCWTLAPPELAVPGAALVFQGSFAGSESDTTTPGMSWVGEFPSTHRMTPVISVKATLIHIGITLWVIFPPILTPHFPEGMKEHTVTDLSSPFWTDPAQQVLHH